MIKNIIFDIGNVLTDFRWKDYLFDRGYDAAMVERIALASVNSPVWFELDRGIWTEEELMDGFIANDPEIEQELRDSLTCITGMVTPRDYACSWVGELKEHGFQVYYLSNFSAKAERDCPDALAFLPLMDGGILSYKEKLIKPDPAIYKLLLDRYGLVAQECIFLDDTPVNVEAAKQLGIHGIVFGTKEQALAEMEQIISGNK